jgi:hypothetical protein
MPLDRGAAFFGVFLRAGARLLTAFFALVAIASPVSLLAVERMTHPSKPARRSAIAMLVRKIVFLSEQRKQVQG